MGFIAVLTNTPHVIINCLRVLIALLRGIYGPAAYSRKLMLGCDVVVSGRHRYLPVFIELIMGFLLIVIQHEIKEYHMMYFHS